MDFWIPIRSTGNGKITYGSFTRLAQRLPAFPWRILYVSSKKEEAGSKKEVPCVEEKREYSGEKVRDRAVELLDSPINGEEKIYPGRSIS